MQAEGAFAERARILVFILREVPMRLFCRLLFETLPYICWHSVKGGNGWDSGIVYLAKFGAENSGPEDPASGLPAAGVSPADYSP
jgi:hypothetical protein